MAAHSYGKGFPLLRQPTVRSLRQLSELFIDTMAGGQPCERLTPGLLLQPGEYRDEVEVVGGFDNYFELRFGQRKAVLRPDAALHNLRRLAARSTPSQVCAVFQGFRSLSGATLPLFRDRYIHPFVQFNQSVQAAALEAELQAALGRLGSYFDTLSLPVRIVDFGSWKEYAQRLYVVIVQLPDGEPTVAAMLYVVGRAYCEQAGLPREWEAFDIGITQKVFALLVMRHSDGGCIRLPSAVAPVQVVVGQEALADLGQTTRLGLGALRTHVIPDASPAVQRWARSGAVLQLYRGRRSLRMFSPRRGWRDTPVELDLVAAMREEDAHLMDRACEADLMYACPPLRAHPESSPGAHGSVVHVSPRLLTRLDGLRLPMPWGGPRVFY